MFYGSVGRVGLRALLAATAYTPASLFAAGEQGVWYQNSDFTTLFQDAAGTTPVTGYEQFVGLRLDKSKGLVLGSELNDGLTDIANWVSFGTNVVSADGDSIKITYTTGQSSQGAYTFLRQSAGLTTNLTVGKWYKLTGQAKVNSGSANVGVTTSITYTSVAITSNSFVDFTIYFSASNETLNYISAGNLSTGEEIWIRGLSVRELPGNHAFQSTTTARAVLSARYNLLTHTEQFDNAAWAKGNCNVTSTSILDPLGGNTAEEITLGGGNFSKNVAQSVTAPTTAVVFSICVKAGTNTFFQLLNSGDAEMYANFNGSTGVVGSVGTRTTAATTNLGNGWYRISATFTPGTFGSSFRLYAVDNNTAFYGAPTSSTGTFYIWGADLRAVNESSALPAYQRVGAAVNGTSTSIGTPDYDTVGFPAYLRYDGGDWYQTNSIDFSTGATNPPLGPELVTNGDFSNGSTGWTLGAGWTVPVDQLVGTSVSSGVYATSPAFTVVAGRSYRVSLTTTVSAGTYSVRFDTGGNETALGTVSATGSYTFYVIAPDTSSVVAIRSLGSFTGTIDNISVKELTDSNYAPDKMSVFAGVRKLSDAGSSNAAVILELSATSDTNNGTFAVLGSNGYVSPNYTFSFASGGTTKTTAFTQSGLYSAPVTNIMTGLGDIYGDRTTLRLNATQIAENTSDQGTGNFGNYPLYLGARGGTTFFYTGREYSTIILGRAVTASELANTEDYMDVQTFGKNMALVYSDELTTADSDLITAADGDQIYMSVNYQ